MTELIRAARSAPHQLRHGVVSVRLRGAGPCPAANTDYFSVEICAGHVCTACLAVKVITNEVCLWKSINACHTQFEASSLYDRASEGMQNLSYMLRHLVMACQRSVNDSVHHLHVLQGLPHVKCICHIRFCRTIVANCKCLAALWWQPTGLTDFKGCLHNA